jgi:hypothetical protein
MRKLLVFSFLLVIGFQSCDRRSTIPVYLRIDDFRIQTNFNTEGTASSKITTVWIALNDKDIGAYELPIVAPIIANGPGKISIIPGINLNGQLALRNQYEFYEPFEQNYDLIPGTEVHIKSGSNDFPITGYNDERVSRIINLETFEGAGVNFEPTNLSDTSLFRTEDENEIFKEAGLNELNERSGKVVVPRGNSLAEFQSINSYDLPKNSANVYLEVNYKCEVPVLFGVIVDEGLQVTKAPVVTVLPRDEWNKIYINLVTEVSAYPNALDYKIFFGAINTDQNSTKTFFLDNLKIVY